MIKRISDIKFLSGVSSPLFPLVYCDFNCAYRDNDGVFVQLSDENVTTAVMSLKNSSLTLVQIAEGIDTDEIEKYIEFFSVKSVVSDFPFNKREYKKMPLMCRESVYCNTHSADVVEPSSGVQVYKSIFELLYSEGDFSVWYPSFSKRINSGFGEAVFKKQGDVIVSTGVCTAIYNNVAIVSGVFTLPSYRGKGYAGDCISTLVSQLSQKGVKEIYLWCENKNTGFYSKLGFIQRGVIYVREDF